MSNQILRQCFKMNKPLALWQRHTYYSIRNIHRVQYSCGALFTNKFPIRTLAITCNLSCNFSTKLNKAPNKEMHLGNFLEQLRTDANKLKRINYHSLILAIDLADKAPASASECLFLISCCSMMPDKPRPEKIALIDQIWQVLVNNNVPTKDQVVHLLRAYKANGKKLNFVEFLEKYKSVAIDIQFYEELLYLACENGYTDGMVEVLSEIKKKDLPLTEQTFNALILGHSRSRNLKNCEMVLDTMHLANLEPTARTYMELARAFIENGASDKAEALLTDKGALFIESQVISIIRTATRRDDQSKIMSMAFGLLPNDAIHNKHIMPELRNTCIELIHANEPRKAYKIIESLPVPKFADNEDTDGFATFFLNELIRSGTKVDDVLEIAQKLVESGRNLRAIHVCCEVALRYDSEDSLRYLTQLAAQGPLRPHYFWPRFFSQHRQNGESGVLQTLNEMKGFQVALDKETISNYVLPKLPLTLKDTRMAIKMLEDRGCKMSDLITPLLAYLIYQERVANATEVVKAYSTRIDKDSLLWPLMTFVKNSKYSNSNVYENLVQLLKALSLKTNTSSSTSSTDAEEYDLSGHLLMELVSNNTKRISYRDLSTLLNEIHQQGGGIRISKFAGEILQQYMQKCNDASLRQQVEEVLRKVCDKKLSAAAAEQFDENVHILHPRDMKLDELECHYIELESKNLNVRGRSVLNFFFFTIV